jgi:hypothetical protein
MGKETSLQNLIGKFEGRHHFGDEGIDGRVILKCILKK